MTTPENFAASCCAEVSEDGILTVACAVRDPNSGGTRKFERSVDLNSLTQTIGERLARWHNQQHGGVAVAGWTDFLQEAANAARSIAESVSTKALFKQVAPLVAPIIPGGGFALAMLTHDTVAKAREGNRVAMAKVNAIASLAKRGNRHAANTVQLMEGMADKMDQKEADIADGAIPPEVAATMAKVGQYDLRPDGYYQSDDPGFVEIGRTRRSGKPRPRPNRPPHSGNLTGSGKRGSGLKLQNPISNSDQQQPAGYPQPGYQDQGGGGGGSAGYNDYDPGQSQYGDGGYHQQVEDQFGLAQDQRGYDPRWGGPTEGGFEVNEANYEESTRDSGDPDYYSGLTVAGILAHPYRTPLEAFTAGHPGFSMTARGLYSAGLGR